MTARAAAGRIAAAWTRIPGNLRGILWLSAGAFLLAVVDVFAKTLGRRFDPLEISLFRYVIGMTLLMPAFVRLGWDGLATRRLGLHALRMSLAVTAQLGIFVSVIYLPLADATALMFSKPLFTTVVAVFLLSEAVSSRRWTATFVGFAGVLIMVRPGSDSMDPVALVAVGAAMSFAVANVLIRKMAPTEPPTRILFYNHVGGITLFAGPAAWVWRTPAGAEWLLMVGVGVFTTLGMVCYVRAFSAGEANAVGPAENLRLIYATLFGFFLFQEIPSVWTGLGAAIIVAATYAIARAEAKRAS